MDRLLVIGLDEPEVSELRPRLPGKTVWFDLLPRIQLRHGRLFVEHPNAAGPFLPVSRVVYHGIFEDDLPLLSALALWGGPCLPAARGMMDCRLRLPCLVRALQATRFGSLLRSYADRGTPFVAETSMVAKWGEWHCGENKVRFQGDYTCDVPTLIEPFLTGEAVRVHLMGGQAWQIRLAGDDWLKSLHHPTAGFMPIDSELLEDARCLQRHFGLEMLAMDYMIAADGAKHLLEVNHIPNVTVFPQIRTAYLDFVVAWANQTAAADQRTP